ncbi:MAG: hypothetical protein O2973_13775 [Gemmatimonadetes bacterium]|nr:hypothetical protein [Gemmatimonadota bacterium]
MTLLFARKPALFACPECGKGMAVYLTRQLVVYACSRCLLRRIAKCRETQPLLPPWVVILEEEAERQVRHEERTARNAGTLDVADYVHCYNCGKIARVGHVRWRHIPGTSEAERRPFCASCHHGDTQDD